MLLHVLALAPLHFQIVFAIIATIPVLVMHNLSHIQKSTELLFHHKPMFFNIPVSVRLWVPMRQYVHIAIAYMPATFPVKWSMTPHTNSATLARAPLRGLFSAWSDIKVAPAHTAIYSHYGIILPLLSFANQCEVGTVYKLRKFII